jgi:hypothetical protein
MPFISHEVDQLEFEMRDIRMHLAVWPNDRFALEKLAICEVALRKARREAAPPMSHQRPRFDWEKVKDPYQDQLEEAANISVKDWLFSDLSRPVPQKMHRRVREQMIMEEPARPVFTFGADYEMDQRWLAAEREKAAGLREDVRTLPEPRPTAETDMYMFPSTAFGLTSMDNVRYGRLG